MFKWQILIAIILGLLPFAQAVALEPGQSFTQSAGEREITVSLVGINTEDAPGTALIIVNGQRRFIENETTQRFGDISVSLARVDLWDNLSGGTAYLTILADQSCTDGIRNQAETDVDCGGPCRGCADGQRCAREADCVSRTCTLGRCEGGSPLPAAATCSDGVQNQDERGIDCGGPCSQSCIISVRNISVFCGEGCFFLNDGCSCPAGVRNQSIRNITEPKANDSHQLNTSEEVINLSIAITEAYRTEDGLVLVIGTRPGKLLGIFPVTVPVQALITPQGALIQKQSPLWGALAP